MSISNKVPWIAETCGRCGKPLKSNKSREIGYGSKCLAKMKIEQEKAQITVDEAIEIADELGLME